MGNEKIEMAHGAGGRMGGALLDEVIMPALGNPILEELHDGARLRVSGNIAFTTDSYVVKPIFFRGGSIGRLAVCGTVNDLAMTGAVAKYLSLALVIEEGFSIDELKNVLADIRAAADEANVKIVTGDTKVVGHGAGDGIYINTAGIGEIIEGSDISPRNIKPGMDIIVSGYLGDHAATIMAARHSIDLPDTVQSDAAPLCDLVKVMAEAAPHIAVMRDPTRGGVAATLNELARQSQVGMLLDEEKIPARDEVMGVCELLGLDILELANEGKLIAIVPHDESENLLRAMKSHRHGKNAAIIGRTTSEAKGEVGLKTRLGAIRVVEMPLGSIAPRIC